MIVAIIPARSGSKRIPRKNIKMFSGKPMIHHSIAAAKAAGVFDRIVVSTDSEEIAAIARRAGAETPFIRPADLADDFTPTAPVLVDAVRRLEAQAEPVECLCCIYATAPFVRPEFIRQGFDLLKNRKVASVFSVTTFPYPIFRALKLNAGGFLEMFWPQYELTRSQDLPEAYHDAGQFYWLDAKALLKQPRLFTPDALPVVLPRHLVQDIDTPEDWQTAEKMFRLLFGDK